MIYDLTIPVFTKTLQNLTHMLDKSAAFAETKKFDTAVLMQARLAPDQFPFIRQIQIACDTAKLGAARLTGKEAPSHDDKEQTLADIKTRIHETIAFLNSLTAKDFEGAAERKITQLRWEGKYMLGHDYVNHHAVPNFYFHVTTAYSILRHNGVDLGKKDYLGELPYKQ